MSLRSKWAAGKAVRAGLALEGAYLNRYVTDEQRSRRPIFNATLRAAASWLFFLRRGGSTRMNQIWALRYRQSGSDRLEKQPTDLRRRHHYMRDGALVWITIRVGGMPSPGTRDDRFDILQLRLPPELFFRLFRGSH